MRDYVREEYVDYDEILRRGGGNFDDEDFALFKCPYCVRVYLMDYEVPTIYLDGFDLTKRVVLQASGLFYCIGCRRRVPDGVWVGEKPSRKFRVSWELLGRSDWAWAARRPTPAG
jgi:hypothetical protein